MTTKKIHNLFVYLSFFIPFILYFLTMAPTVSLWDCGEFISTSVIMGVPHPPGTPLYLIISNFFSQIPIFSDIGARVNLVSPIASALSVMFLYMSIVYLIEEFQKEKNESLIKNYTAFIGWQEDLYSKEGQSLEMVLEKRVARLKYSRATGPRLSSCRATFLSQVSTPCFSAQ